MAVYCEWSDWQIGQSSVTCGGGNRTNSRTKTVEESNGGVCAGEATVQEACNDQNCPGKINMYPMYFICQSLNCFMPCFSHKKCPIFKFETL